VKLLTPVVLALVCAASSAQASTAVPSFDHVVVVVFENKESGSVLGSRRAPTFNAYAGTHARATRYYGVTHPSLPNYLALVAGSTFGYKTNCVNCPINARSLADTIEASGRAWKAYAEGLPGRGFLGAASRRYAKKHNPFAYFTPIIRDPERAKQIVPLTELATDVAAGELPDFAFIVPDLCNSIGQGRRRLAASHGRAAAPAAAHRDLHHVRRGHDARPWRRSHSDTRRRHGRAAEGRLLEGDQPLRPAPHGRGRLGPAATRTVGTRAADHRHLAVEGFGDTAGMRQPRCWLLSPQRKPRATRRPRRIARA
jgi:hypothetical protein